ncbi:MAG: ketopantoate reductase family protein [Neptuniibacter sp.]
MRIVIWGAGGIGCYYGSKLQLAGHEITYVARGDHLEAMQLKGLVVEHERLSFSGAVSAVDQTELLNNYNCDDFDLIVLTVKANATQEIISQSRHWLSRGQTPVLSLQNGVENEQLIAEAVGNSRTLGGLAVRIGGHIQEPGVVTAKGIAQIVLGCWPSVAETNNTKYFTEKLVDTFNRAGIPTTHSEDIQKELWRKLLINNGVNPLSALTELDTKSITHDSVYKHVVYKMMEETALAARNHGVDITERDVDEMFNLISEFDAIKTSMLVDKEKGRPLELDGICGPVLRNTDNGQALLTALISNLLKH